MKSELLEFRDELGLANQGDQKEIISMLVSRVMDCLTEIDSLRAQVDNLKGQVYRMQNPI